MINPDLRQFQDLSAEEQAGLHMMRKLGFTVQFYDPKGHTWYIKDPTKVLLSTSIYRVKPNAQP
jgi:hypothetical protein